MKTRIVITAGLLMGIFITLLVATGHQPKPGSDEEVAVLRKRMTGLERELSALRDQLGRLEVARGNARMNLHHDVATSGKITNWLYSNRTNQPLTTFSSEVPGKTAPKRYPKVWGEGEFNGWKYYDIPLTSR